MVRLRQQGQREAGRLWGRVKPDDLDGTFPLGQLELTVSALQREAARLSSAYLSTFIASELGEPERPPALSVWDKAFGGGDLREGLRSAVIKTKVAIGEGEDPQRATKNSRAILVSDVGLFIDTAARESLRQGMEMDDRIVGYQRALKGTCGACSGSTSYEAFSPNAPVAPLNVHPNCQCVAEPVVTGKSPNDLRETRLNTADRIALDHYVGTTEGRELNAALRSHSLNEFQQRAVERLDDAMERAGSLGDPITAYRQINADIGTLTKGQAQTIQDLVGKSFPDEAFGSATSDLRTAWSYGSGGTRLDFELVFDSKVKAIWGANPAEGELVFQRGCRYVVENVRRVGKTWRVRARILPPD
jgi:hypothetical protein